MDEVNFEVTKDTTTYSQLLQKYDLIKLEFGIDWLVVQWRDLRTPLYCGLAIWLYMYTIEEPIPSNIHDQAGHWMRNYNPAKDPEDFVNPVREWERNYPGCYRDIDLYIVLDSSSSIGEFSYVKAKTFVANLISGFTIAEDGVRVGLIIYGATPIPTFYLNYSFNKNVIVGKIKSVKYLSSSTATGDAIRFMTNTGFTEEHGVRASDGAIPRVAIVLTDGESDRGQNVPGAAQSARDQSIEMFAFGIGSNINEIELLQIAGSPERVFRIDSFSNIDDVKAMITRGSCKSTVKATVNLTYSGNLTNGQSKVFEFTVDEGGITIETHTNSGMITLFGSYTNPNPSPVWHDHVVQGIQDSITVLIPHLAAVKRRQADSIVFYCSLVGVDSNNEFSIKALRNS
ncbi:collagen alpha-1(XII) chain-like [Dysidea avara]|uniref:collagen alpha-1(XII) chain-like n=1 Tax=Dysidea avara TaxID=196820 RepID=UPI00332757E6